MFKFSDKIFRTTTLTSLLGLFVNFEYISQIFPVFQYVNFEKMNFYRDRGLREVDRNP